RALHATGVQTCALPISALQQAMREARRSGASRDSIATLQQRLRTAMLGLMPYRMAFHAKVRALVTPEQAKIMDDRQQEMLQQMQDRKSVAEGGRGWCGP